MIIDFNYSLKISEIHTDLSNILDWCRGTYNDDQWDYEGYRFFFKTVDAVDLFIVRWS